MKIRLTMLALLVVSSCRFSEVEPKKRQSISLQKKDLTCYFFFMAKCPASRNNIPKIVSLKNKYEKYGVAFRGIVAEPDIDTVYLRKTIQEFNVNFEILIDDSLNIAKAHQAIVNPQVFLYGCHSDLVYSGLVDDYYYSLSKHKLRVKENYLENAILEYLSDKAISTATTTPIGCKINYNYFK